MFIQIIVVHLYQQKQIIMNREIKFRGQNQDSKEWFIGSYQSEPCPNITFINSSNELDTSEVDPKTVGQFTGLKDKNGVDIYEGDIVRVLYNQNSDNYSGNNFNYTDHVCTVEFGEYSSRFVLRNFTEKYKNKHNFTTIGFDHRRLQRDLIEVIGNIHQNPELIK